MKDNVSFELLRLNKQLCFALYAATRAMSRAYGRRLGPLGLTYPQYLVLIVLWENDGITLSEIGDKLMLDSGTLTPLVKRLEASELVTRRRRTSDEREVEVHLTGKGRRLEKSAVGVRKYIVCRLKQSEDEIARLRADVMRIIDTISEDEDAGAGAEPDEAPKRPARAKKSAVQRSR